MTANDENRLELLVLLSEPITALGRFEQAELDYILEKSEDIYQAAALGWQLKADKIISTGGLVSSMTLGAESIKFANIADTMAYCSARSKQYQAMSAAVASAALLLGLSSGSIGPEIETVEDEE